MQNLNIEDGLQAFTINNDPSRVIRFNPADIGIIERFSEARQAIEKAQADVQADIRLNPDGTPEGGSEDSAALVSRLSQVIRQQVDHIFDAPVSDTVFGGASPLATHKGVPYFERLLTAIGPIIQKAVKAEQAASEKRMAKYTRPYKS